MPVWWLVHARLGQASSELAPVHRSMRLLFARHATDHYQFALPAAVGDIYPEPVQLKKGEYTIRAVLRHDDAALLEKLKVGCKSWTNLSCAAAGPMSSPPLSAHSPAAIHLHTRLGAPHLFDNEFNGNLSLAGHADGV